MVQPDKKKAGKLDKSEYKKKRKKTTASPKRKRHSISGRRYSEESNKTSARKRKQTHKKRVQKKNLRKHKSIKKKPLKIILMELGITVIIFAIVIFALSKLTFTAVKVEGYSMTEQLNDGDRVFINRMKQPNHFKLVAFKDDKGEILIRRVIGIPGDRLYYKEDQLYINEEEQLERYLESAVSVAKQGGMRATEDFTLVQLTGKETVPEDKYFLLGDNRQYATDSRYFGFVDKKNIIGVVEFRFFPFHTLTGF